MRLTIDTEAKRLTEENADAVREVPLYSREAFELISRQWVKIGWDQKYPYMFSWLGRPIIQLPEDMFRIQEVIYSIKPDVVIETGIAHGGSLVFYASLCRAMGKGRVIGVDIEIRRHNREAIETHELAPLITLVEGDSVSDDVVQRVKSLVAPAEAVLVILDSCHTKEHVRAELDAYHHLVSPGSYIVVTDGIMKDLHDVPRGQAAWKTNHPAAAASEFAREHPEFVLQQPPRVFNESSLCTDVTHWPGAWLRRREPEECTAAYDSELQA